MVAVVKIIVPDQGEAEQVDAEVAPVCETAVSTPDYHTIALTIQYDGSVFHGWQRQKGDRTVQEEVERALSLLTKTPCTLHGAGRTDTGVHALGQRAHFHTTSRIPLDRWCVALNSILDPAVRVVHADEMPSDWHARFTPHWKHYRYTIDRSEIGSPLTRLYTWQRPGTLDVTRMQQAAQLVVGHHSFQAFCASGSKVQNFWRTLRVSQWTEEGSLLHYDVEGNGFLYHMVRLLVGSMSEVGCGKLEAEAIAHILEHGNSTKRLLCAPPQGLCLVKIVYDSPEKTIDISEETV